MSHEARTDQPITTAAAVGGDASKVAGEQPISRLQRDGVQYPVIGTAHVSRASMEAVAELTASGRFDAVALPATHVRGRLRRGGRRWGATGNRREHDSSRSAKRIVSVTRIGSGCHRSSAPIGKSMR